MPDTITAFYEFTPGTKARSSEVTQNFRNYRGTILPINTDTASSSHLTHDLGAATHRWSTAYLGTVDIRTQTSTGAVQISGDTAITAGAMKITVGGVEKFRLDSDGIDGQYMKAGSHSLIAVTFTANGTFTVPAGVTQIFAYGCGGGGGGGGGQGGVFAGARGGGGGGGSIVSKIALTVAPGTVLSITVGSAGASGNGGAPFGGSGLNGSTGGSSIIASTATTYYQWLGGDPGQSGGSGSAGATAATYCSKGGLGGATSGAGAIGGAHHGAPAGSGGTTSGTGGAGGGGGSSGYRSSTAIGTGGAGGNGDADAGGAAGAAQGYGSGGGGGGGAGGANSGAGGGSGAAGIVCIYYMR